MPFSEHPRGLGCLGERVLPGHRHDEVALGGEIDKPPSHGVAEAGAGRL